MKLYTAVKRNWLWVVLLLGIAGGAYWWTLQYSNGILFGIKLESDEHFAQRMASDIWGRRMQGAELTLHINELVTGTQTRAQLRQQFTNWKTTRTAANLPV